LRIDVENGSIAAIARRRTRADPARVKAVEVK
jgi:hypothetical protein